MVFATSERRDGRGTAAYLILDQELDTLNRSGGSLGHSGSDTTHCDKVSAQSIEAGFTELTQEIYHEAEFLSLACTHEKCAKRKSAGLRPQPDARQLKHMVEDRQPALSSTGQGAATQNLMKPN